MSHLLTKISGSKLMNGTYWEPVLMVYNDFLIWRKRKWFTVKEITIPYKQIAQVNITTNIFFAELEIVIIGNDTRTVKIKYAPKSPTIKVKKIIDQKVHLIHANDEKMNNDVGVKNLEKSIARLSELLDRQKITKKEFEKKRKELMNF